MDANIDREKNNDQTQNHIINLDKVILYKVKSHESIRFISPLLSINYRKVCIYGGMYENKSKQDHTG